MLIMPTVRNRTEAPILNSSWLFQTAEKLDLFTENWGPQVKGMLVSVEVKGRVWVYSLICAAKES